MSKVKDYYWNVAGKDCLGDYWSRQECLHCWATDLCKEEAIKLDGFYDQQAEERAWWEDYECSHH